MRTETERRRKISKQSFIGSCVDQSQWEWQRALTATNDDSEHEMTNIDITEAGGASNSRFEHWCRPSATDCNQNTGFVVTNWHLIIEYSTTQPNERAMSTARDDAEVNAVVHNGQVRKQNTLDTRSSRSLSALKTMTASYQSLASREGDEAVRSVVSQELSLSSTPHSINDILARSTRSTSPQSLSLQSSVDRTSLPMLQTNVSITKTPIVRLASPVGLAVRAASGTGSSSLYWAAAAAASLMSPSLCWNRRGT